jgi:PAS domain S-box-containing protein
MTSGRRRFLLITSLLVGALVLPVVVLPPLAWWVRGNEIHADEMRMESQYLAEELAGLIGTHPDTWRIERRHLHDLVGVDRFPVAGDSPERRLAFDAQGKLVFAAGESGLDPPIIAARNPVRGHPGVAAFVEVQRSLRPLLVETLAIGLAGLTAGGLLMLVLWRWVLRGLRRAWTEMEVEKGRVQVTLSSIVDALFTVDREGRITFLNVTAESLSGWPSEEAIGRHLDEVVRPQANSAEPGSGVPVWLDLHAEGYQSGEIVNRIGARYKVDWVVTPVTGEGHEGYVVVIRNVTAERLAEEALRQSEARLNEAQRIAHLGSWEWHLSSGSLHWSDEVFRIFGFDRQQQAPSYFRFLMAVHREDRKAIHAVFTRALAGQQDSYLEFRILRPDGSLRHIEGRGSLLRDLQGRPLRMFGTLLDVTERRQIEQALRRSAERLAIMHRVDEAILAAHSAEEIADAALSHLQRLVPFMRASVYVQDDERHVRVLAAQGLKHIPARVGERLPLDDTFRYLRLALQEGEAILQPVSVADDNATLGALAAEGVRYVFIVPLRWQKKLIGSLNFAIGDEAAVEGEARVAILEIAEALAVALRQAMLNAEVASYAERLERTVAERTAELMRAARSKDEFLAAMSHELRTPLTAVLGLAEVLREQLYGPLTDKQEGYIRQIEDSGRHLLELINDILDLAKIEAGKLEIEIDTVATARLVEGSLNLVRPAAAKKGIRLDQRLDETVAQLQVDGRRIKQALVNLLANAVKFTPEGGRVSLEVRGDAALREARLSVHDSGIGIAASDQARLFQPFVQIDSTLSRQYGGTGLGLALVKRMAELHGGRVEVESQPGQGSVFSLVLPWSAAAAATSVSPPEPGEHAPAEGLPLPPQGLRVLVVDDNEANRTLVGEYLASHACKVMAAGSGSEALALLAQDPLPDQVLLDVRMPGIDGIEILARIRAQPRTRDLRVVALTAQAMPGDRARLIGQGFDDYLAKPFSLRALLQVLCPEVHG